MKPSQHHTTTHTMSKYTIDGQYIVTPTGDRIAIQLDAAANEHAARLIAAANQFEGIPTKKIQTMPVSVYALVEWAQAMDEALGELDKHARNDTDEEWKITRRVVMMAAEMRKHIPERH